MKPWILASCPRSGLCILRWSLPSECVLNSSTDRRNKPERFNMPRRTYSQLKRQRISTLFDFASRRRARDTLKEIYDSLADDDMRAYSATRRRARMSRSTCGSELMTLQLVPGKHLGYPGEVHSLYHRCGDTWIENERQDASASLRPRRWQAWRKPAYSNFGGTIMGWNSRLSTLDLQVIKALELRIP